MTHRMAVDWRCGVLDLLEAAAMRRAPVDVRIEGRWQRVTVVDVPSENGEDWLLADSGERIPLNAIEAARPSPGTKRNC